MRHLVLILLLVGINAFAVEPMETSVDWRQLYYRTNRVRWFAKSIPDLRADAQRGHAVAKYVFAQKVYAEQNKSSFADAERFQKEAEDAGLPQSLIDHVNQLGKPENDAQVRMTQLELATRAADSGYPIGKVLLATILVSGRPIRPDPEQALALLRSAREAGEPTAVRTLGYLLAAGIGEPRNAGEKPSALFLEAASLGDEESLQIVAHRFRVGYAVPKNLLRAAKIAFSITVKERAFDVRNTLLPENDPDAPIFNRLLNLFEAGLRKGDAKALTTLAEMHERGENGEVNLGRAATLYEMAARAGDASARGKSLALKGKFSPADQALYDMDLRWMSEARR